MLETIVHKPKSYRDETYRGLKAGEVENLRAGRGGRAGSTEGAERGGDLVDECRHDHLLGDPVQHHPY